jgi:hypothetical protein
MKLGKMELRFDKGLEVTNVRKMNLQSGVYNKCV